MRGQFTFIGVFPRFTVAANFFRADPGAKRRKRNLLQKQSFFLFLFLFLFIFLFIVLFIFLFIFLFLSLSLVLPLSLPLYLSLITPLIKGNPIIMLNPMHYKYYKYYKYHKFIGKK